MTGPETPVVLVGLMGSGKTTVAGGVADALGRPMRDSDEDLVARYGASAAQQYARYGVDVLHRREAEQLRRALAARPAPVIAAAASVVDDPDCRAALADAYVVWLDAPPEVLASRVGDQDHRPDFHPRPREMLDRQYRQRLPRFQEVTDLRVDAGERGPDATVAAVLAALTGEPPGGSDTSH